MDPEPKTDCYGAESGLPGASVRTSPEATTDESNAMPDSDVLTDQDFRNAAQKVREAKKIAKPLIHESELVVLGTLTPDHRLPNVVQDLESQVLRSVRRKFKVGWLPPRT
jgi:hypothetical protein